mmetsp:Transcript_18807/g.21188  ORF Transcript_18807/g.21188 Transcript_18807/m.21188 type:complete len:635 (-) Transcript_18807:77-1981(-)
MPDSTNTNKKNDNKNADWRSSVFQSYRNAEVREIAKVLAALEGSASVTPASKLMLAMRFEDQIFKSAGSLADYRKKISKRLKKLQKNYVAKVPNAAAAAGGTIALDNKDDNVAATNELRTRLRNTYGEHLRYIVKHDTAAIEDLKRKLGPEKASQLQQHTNSCRSWARDLEVLTKEDLTDKKKSNCDDNKTVNVIIESNAPLSLAQLQRMEKHLQTRVGNIRSYVVKHADPDQFLLETLQSKDKQFSKNVEAGNLFRKILTGQISSQRDMVKKQTEEEQQQNQHSIDNTDDSITILQRAVEKSQVGVPPPTRNDSKQIEASLRHLDKMRAASTAMMTYWTLKGDERLATAPRDTLKKIHDVVQEGTDFVLCAVKEREEQQVDNNSSSSSGRVSLQDSWSKTIELPSSATIEEAGDNSDITGASKRLRTNSYRPYYKVRRIFHPQRKTPPSLLSAIRRKGARLFAPNGARANSIYLVLDFEEAFTMTIYLSPLTVTLRAKVPGDTGSSTSGNSGHRISNPSNAATVAWIPLSYGLTSSSTTMTKNGGARHNETQHQQRQLSVWGVTSTYDSIGRVVEERLRDASTHATAKLRKCFQNHVKDKTVDFEVELLEGSALLEYLQVVRATYMPHWEDTD